MNEKAGRGLAVFAFALIALVAFFGARYWRSAQHAWIRVDPQTECDLRAGPCRRMLAGGALEFSISPAEIPLMKPLRLNLVTEGLVVDEVWVEIRGLNMDMGRNRTRLQPTGETGWWGETILPICSQRAMEWEAAVQMDADGRFEVPFRFQTIRP